ncbi:MAG TPA: hypothetical protein VMT85_24540 [Thermoanaerobaculia bacterium]|nr:hypothetical protein [Thermoanaerobaculia bacterium]
MIRRFVRSILAVALWEIRERRAPLVAGLAVGVLVPIVGALGQREIPTTAAAVSMTFGGVVALLFGGTMITSDLVEGRLGFLFAQPIPAAAVYWGRFAGATLAAAACQVVTLLPSVVVGIDPLGFDQALARWWWSVLAALPAAVAVAHVLASIVRLRTAWTLLDVGAAFALTWMTTVTLGKAELVGLDRHAWLAAIGFLAMAGLIALSVGGPLQVARGRTERSRSHRFLTLGLWAVPLATSAALALGVDSWSRVTLEEIDTWSVDVPTSSEAEWIVIEGWQEEPGTSVPTRSWLAWLDPRRSVYAVLVARPADGVWHQLPAGSDEARISADGRWITWLQRQPSSTAVDLLRLDIETLGSQKREIEPLPTGIGWDRPPLGYSLSPDGSWIGARIRVEGPQRLAIHEVGSGRLVIQSAPIEDSGVYGFGWIDDTRVRLVTASTACEVFTLDAATGTSESARTTRVADPMSLRCVVDPAGERILVAEQDSLALFTADGQELASRAYEGGRPWPWFVDDHLFVRNPDDEAALHLLDSETLASVATWRSHPVRFSPVAAQGSAGLLQRRVLDAPGVSYDLLDLDTGRISELADTLADSPLASGRWIRPVPNHWPPRIDPPSPSSERLFIEPRGLFAVDLEARAWRWVLRFENAT